MIEFAYFGIKCRLCCWLKGFYYPETKVNSNVANVAKITKAAEDEI